MKHALPELIIDHVTGDMQKTLDAQHETMTACEQHIEAQRQHFQGMIGTRITPLAMSTVTSCVHFKTPQLDKGLLQQRLGLGSGLVHASVACPALLKLNGEAAVAAHAPCITERSNGWPQIQISNFWGHDASIKINRDIVQMAGTGDPVAFLQMTEYARRLIDCCTDPDADPDSDLDLDPEEGCVFIHRNLELTASHFDIGFQICLQYTSELLLEWTGPVDHIGHPCHLRTVDFVRMDQHPLQEAIRCKVDCTFERRSWEATVLVFQSGRILIAGARHPQILQDAYSVIMTYLCDHQGVVRIPDVPCKHDGCWEL